MADLTAIALAVASTIIAAFGFVLFKAASGSESLRKILFSRAFVSGGILFVFGTALFILALKLDELSALFPITSLTYIWVMLLARKFLHETIGKWKVLAVLFIVAGIVFVTL